MTTLVRILLLNYDQECIMIAYRSVYLALSNSWTIWGFSGNPVDGKHKLFCLLWHTKHKSNTSEGMKDWSYGGESSSQHNTFHLQSRIMWSSNKFSLELFLKDLLKVFKEGRASYVVQLSSSHLMPRVHKRRKHFQLASSAPWGHLKASSDWCCSGWYEGYTVRLEMYGWRLFT